MSEQPYIDKWELVKKEVRFIREHLGKGDAEGQLCEELGELTAAVEKLSRILRGTNPARIGEAKARSLVIEELTDVFVCLLILDWDYDDKTLQLKLDRWAGSLGYWEKMN